MKIANFIKTHHRKILVFVVLIVFAGVITERLVTQGTLMGYQILSKPNPISSESEQPSEACKRADAKFVSSVLGASVERIALGFADQPKPFRSICSYATKGKGRRYVTIVMRDTATDSSAKSQLVTLAERKDSKAITGFGHEAYFTAKSRQLTIRQGKRIITVTISDPSKQSNIASLEAAKKIALKLL